MCYISFVTEYFDTAQQLPITTKYYLRQSERNPVVFDNHDSFTRNEIRPMYIYLFVGLGIVFILLIFIMIIELYKRVKLAKGKMVIEQPCDETRLRGESSNSGTHCNTRSRQFREECPHLLVDFEY